MHPPVILVTGATDGIGRQTALELSRRGAEVIVHGRTLAKAEQVARELGESLDRPPLASVAADLSSLAEVRQLASELSEHAPRLSVLLHNAGVFDKERQLTVDGFERTLQVNYLAPFLLSHLLLERLRENAPARVVVVSSIAHQRGRLDLEDLHGARKFDGYGAYAASKLATVLFTNELARRLGMSGVATFSLHPGVITTKLLQHGFGISGASLEEGTRTSVFAALDPSLAEKTGLYLSDGKVASSSTRTHDAALMRALYDESCRLVGIDGLPA